MADIAFDSSYLSGGEGFDPERLFGIHEIRSVLIPPANGRQFVYDPTNKKIKVLSNAPAIVYEEKHTIADNAITLNYPAAYIMGICQADGPLKLTTSGATLAAAECKPSSIFTKDARPTINFHSGASGVVYVTYITQAWKEVWDNLVQEEVVAVTTNTGNLVNQAIAIQAIKSTGTTSTNCCLMDDKDDTVATAECAIDMTSTSKSLTFAAADVVTSAVVTYIKKPSSGFLLNRFIAEEAMSAASNVCTPAYPILLWGYSGQIPENGALTEQFISLAGTAGANESKFDLMFHTTRITGHSITTGTAMYVWGRPWEIPAVPLELVDGDDLSVMSSVSVLVIGT